MKKYDVYELVSVNCVTVAKPCSAEYSVNWETGYIFTFCELGDWQHYVHGLSTARGYRRPSKAAGSQGHDSAGSVGVINPDEADEPAHPDSSPSSPPFSPSNSLLDSDSESLRELSDDAAPSLKKVCDL